MIRRNRRSDGVVFLLLLAIKVVANLFYRIDMRLLGEVPARPWQGIRQVAFLNHTSLFEPLFARCSPASTPTPWS